MVTVGTDESKLRFFLSAHTRQSWEYQRQPARITTYWQPLAELRAGTSLAQQLDKLMFMARHRTGSPGEGFEFDPNSDYPLIDAPCVETCSFLFSHAVEIGLVTLPLTLSLEDSSNPVITFKGWEYLESRSGFLGAPKRAFVAMSFNPDLAPAFDHGIQPALEIDCGLSCIRIDRVHHNEKICDKILAEIRRCQILIADFTGQRPGVYFEAGFGLALGRTVIWTVRDDEIDKVHFDTRQYNHIVWKDPADLRAKLADRIQATAVGHLQTA